MKDSVGEMQKQRFENELFSSEAVQPAAIQRRERLRDIGRTVESLLPASAEPWSLMLTQNAPAIARILHLDQLYRQILDVPGVVCEFGVHWGASVSVLMNLRSIYEPWNSSRRIVGFDTFSGFPTESIDDVDLQLLPWQPGDYASHKDALALLHETLAIHQSFMARPSSTSFELVAGDVTETFEQWLRENPGSVVALAIFDMDLYLPTRRVLELIAERLTKGSVLVFDELNVPEFPGETLAVMEQLGLGNLRLRRGPHSSSAAWAVVGE